MQTIFWTDARRCKTGSISTLRIETAAEKNIRNNYGGIKSIAMLLY